MEFVQSHRNSQRSSARRRCAALLLSALVAPTAVGAADAPPFATLELTVPGRPVQAWAARLGTGCPARGGRHLMVLSLGGVPPNEVHHWSAFDCLTPADPAATPARLWTRALPKSVIAVDTADIRPELPGDELVWLSAAGLQWLEANAASAPRAVAGSGGLPLPARNRGLSRVPLIDDWEARAIPSALVPTTAGVRLVSLSETKRLDIALPIESSYRTRTDEPPAPTSDLLKAYLTWPQLARADDDGDGRPDLFALWRFGAWVFRTGEDGLPTEPSRVVNFQPFDDEQEIRHDASDVEIFARDVNADGLADLVVDRTMGGMLSSFASTEVHLNTGDGATLDGEPAARFESEGAIASVELIDLDADGSAELFRTALHFNVFQMLRFVVTGRARVEFAAMQLDPTAKDGWVETWSDAVSLDLDWRTGRIAGVFPDVRSDVDGDGRPDLILPSGSQRFAVRLGRPAGKPPGFGSRVATQKLPVEAGSLWPGDLDGDGLDDLVIFDPRDRSGKLFVLRNQAMLGAARPTLQAPEGE